MNLPNKLTMLRIILVPVYIIFFMLNWFIPAMIVFIVASLTDMLDGKIARKYGLVTNFGKIMDPLADKILVYSAFCLFVGHLIIPAWMLIVILAREFMISGMRTVAASTGTVIAAGMSGKIKTVLQMAAVILLLLAMALTGSGAFRFFYYLAMAVLWASLVMTVYSGLEYVIKNIGVFKENK